MSLKHQLFEITEEVSNLAFLFEKTEVMVNDLTEQLHRKTNLNTPIEIACAQKEKHLLRIKADILEGYISDMSPVLMKLQKQSEHLYEATVSNQNVAISD